MIEPAVSKQALVEAPDGTRLAVTELGEGPPLVICHGAFTVASDWLPFAQRLARQHRVVLYDRRGHGQSIAGPGQPADDADVHDLAAVMAYAGPEAAILGHSFGGSCALAYAARGGFAGPLIVYEPPHPGREPVSRGLVPQIEQLVASGNLDAAAEFAINRVVGMPLQVIDGFRASPLWETMAATVTAFPAELRFLDSLTWRPGDLDAIAGTPTLLIGSQTLEMAGSPSPAALLTDLLPGLQVVTIPDQGHIAYLLDPDGLAAIVGQCLAAS